MQNSLEHELSGLLVGLTQCVQSISVGEPAWQDPCDSDETHVADHMWQMIWVTSCVADHIWLANIMLLDKAALLFMPNQAGQAKSSARL